MFVLELLSAFLLAGVGSAFLSILIERRGLYSRNKVLSRAAVTSYLTATLFLLISIAITVHGVMHLL